jgi:hypothetical protein
MDEELSITIDKYGTKYWRNEKRQIHRLDGPAVEYNNGDKEWYQNGSLHRLDGPAVIARGGFKQWYLNGYILKNKQDFFESLSEEDKKIALFSIDFLNN